MKSRGVYETPGGTILYTAIQELEYLCLDRDTQAFKRQSAIKFAELVYDGKWLHRFVNQCQLCLTLWTKLLQVKSDLSFTKAA